MFSLRFAILIISCLLIPSTLCVSPEVIDFTQPGGTLPPRCVDSYPGAISFQLVDDPTPFAKVHCIQPGSLNMSLENGLLVDHLGRIGSIVSNRQFLFDGPPAQAGAIYTGGWALCSDNLIALGPQKQFYACASGDCKLPEISKGKGR